jgi:hypothetical protein
MKNRNENVWDLEYSNIEREVLKPEHKEGFTDVVFKDYRWLFKDFNSGDFKNDKELYVMAYTHLYLEDYKNKKQVWYNKMYIKFLSDNIDKIPYMRALTIGGWLNTKENRYNVDLGCIITNLDMALELKKKYKQLSGWDLINFKEI